MGWIQDLADPKSRRWEDFYRNLWQHDNITRSTHGVNCTGGCSWAVYSKDGIITWEMQQTDYPALEEGLPPYEPRGCQRGISASWYVYSPIRVKYPYVRGSLLEFWRDARANESDPVKAWESIVSDETKRTRYQQSRGKGGFRRSNWDEVLEIVSASAIYTAKKWGPDRVFGFSPIPAMSYNSYAAGSRFLQLFGGVSMSFYDWYADLPNAFPETWGDQTDVCESADWYNSKYIVSVAANLNMTRTPDVHFISEARQNGTKFTVISPDFSQVAKFSDWWIPVVPGQDTALWMAVNHVILKEFYVDRQVPYFVDYLKQYTDTPFLVEMLPNGDSYKPAQLLRANRLARYDGIENGDWKLAVYDETSDEPRMPKGSIGFRWGEEDGKWNLKMEDGVDDTPLNPALSFLEKHDEVFQVEFEEFAEKKVNLRGVPVRTLQTIDGPVQVATVFDLLMAQFGVDRSLPGDYATDYDDASAPYTPAWQEQFTGIARDTILQLAREFASNSEVTEGKSMIITGASLNHWYNNNHSYRAPITSLILTGSCGVNGGGLNHYVGQEKLTLVAPWSTMAFAADWGIPARRQQSPIWHYVNSDQWRYEGDFTEYASVPEDARWAKGHAVDLVAKSVRMGWMPYYPQFDRHPFEIVKEAEEAGATDSDAIIQNVVGKLQSKDVNYSIDDPDAPENWPRLWFIWRGNAIQSSAKGSEFFLRHYLGTHDNVVAEEKAAGKTNIVNFHETAPRGKMDLVVDINFRMDSSALYSDIVLPTAMWYEKNDLNSTDLHSFVHPLGAAVPPVWESKTDWDIFKAITKKVSEMAPDTFPEPVKDIVSYPLGHDTPDELAQTEVADWAEGECEPIPGKTMPHLRVIERDYSNLYNKFITFGRSARENGINGNGAHIPIADAYDDLLTGQIGGAPDPKQTRVVEWEGTKYPSLEDSLDAANMLLALAPETNGQLAYDGFKHEEIKTGLDLASMAEKNRGVRMTFADLTQQPRRTLLTPCWTGDVNDGRAYSAWVLNVEHLIPWRTLSGRQHLYVDHPYYLDFGEQMVTYKPKLDPVKTGDIGPQSPVDDESLVLNYITPHGKWNIHSTYKDNHRMLTLSRGMDPVWINDKDADRIGLKDNDWVEMYNDNGVVVTRANVSARVQTGMCLYYHAVERTVYIPKSQVRGGKRAGGHNSLTRTRINPVQLAGGYAQFTYMFNYWGPIGIFTRDTNVVIRKLEKLEW